MHGPRLSMYNHSSTCPRFYALRHPAGRCHRTTNNPVHSSLLLPRPAPQQDKIKRAVVNTPDWLRRETDGRGWNPKVHAIGCHHIKDQPLNEAHAHALVCTYDVCDCVRHRYPWMGWLCTTMKPTDPTPPSTWLPA